MNYLVISDREITYHDTAESAARAATNAWSWAAVVPQLTALGLGDELDVTDSVSVLRISGTNPRMK